MLDIALQLVELAELLNANQQNQLTDNEWLLITSDNLSIQFTQQKMGLLLGCCPLKQALNDRWYPLLLSYNGLLASTGGMVMGLTPDKQLLIQLQLHDLTDLTKQFNHFIQLVKEWQAKLEEASSVTDIDTILTIHPQSAIRV